MKKLPREVFVAIETPDRDEPYLRAEAKLDDLAPDQRDGRKKVGRYQLVEAFEIEPMVRIIK